MFVDPNKFLLSLVSALNRTTTPAIATMAAAGVSNAGLWVTEAIEGLAADPYAVFRIYGGPTPNGMLPRDACSVQCMVTAKREAAGMTLAWKLFQSLYAEIPAGCKRPRHSWMIAALRETSAGAIENDPDYSTVGGGYEVRFITITNSPATISRDAKLGQSLIAFNFDVSFAARLPYSDEPSTPPHEVV